MNEDEIERLKRIITAILGRCADLLDADQFNSIEALAADVEPTFDNATNSLRAALTTYKRIAERNHKANLLPCPRCGYTPINIHEKS
jgi:hypothetical protein